MNDPAPPIPYRYELELLESLAGRPGWLWALGLSLLAIVAVTLAIHLRERRAVPGVASVAMGALRLLAIAGVLLWILGPQRRDVQEVVRQSQVVLLVDTSASMALPLSMASNGEPTSRTEAAIALLNRPEVLAELTKRHAVSVAPSSSLDDAVEFALSEADSPPPALEGAAFQPSAPQTRLGDAMRETLTRYAGQPLAGVVLLTDGQNNGGEDPLRVAEAARAAGTRVLTVGFGPLERGANLLIRDLVAPDRALPGDEIEITALIETTGELTGVRSFNLFERMADEPGDAARLLATLGPPEGAAGGAYAVSFKHSPSRVGKTVYRVEATAAPEETRNDDNRREVTVDVVEQLTRVLLWAGGPNRDYRFLRGRLSRDETFEADTLLQSAGGVASQEVRKVLDEFPTTAEQLDEYDVLVAFDPDWSGLSPEQCRLLEEWVAKSGGGIYFAPGPVNTPKWSQRGPTQLVAPLLPVALPDRLTVLDPVSSQRAATRPKPVRLTRAGVGADFLWIGGDAEASRAAWSTLDGFYRIGQVASLRAGATLYAEALDEGESRALFAEHYYGAGRVFFSAASETWRLRSADPNYFDTLWTKLLRRLAYGRLAAGQQRSRLLFERPRYLIGDTMVVRALAPDEDADAELRVQVVSPGGAEARFALQPNAAEPGAWIAMLPARQEGTYHVFAEWPGAESLEAKADVAAPAAERDNPIRNAELLAALAAAGDGYYYADEDAAAVGANELPPLADAIPPQTETRTVLGEPDAEFAERVSFALLGVIAGSLIVEWLTRRLLRLA